MLTGNPLAALERHKLIDRLLHAIACLEDQHLEALADELELLLGVQAEAHGPVLRIAETIDRPGRRTSSG